MSTDVCGGNILIVDDVPANLRLLSNMLVKQGYKVRSVTSGQMGLTAARAAPPDLILLDVSMPEMNGYEVCEQLKSDPRTREIPVLFISALNETHDKVRAFTCGGVDYITKPFQVEEVLARVQTHLALRNLQRQLQESNHELQKRVDELDAFAHTVAHDLKNPLSALILHAELLAEIPNLSPDKMRQRAQYIIQSAHRMADIIESLLLLAGVRKQEVVYEPLDMGSILAAVQEGLSYMIQQRQAEMILPASWPAALGYKPWVEAVWTNYISNAIKYGGDPPRVEVGFDECANEPAHLAPSSVNPHMRYIRFWVRDNGPGISPEDQARLFTPFTRIHHERAKGHGLGLSIVQRIVERLGGQVGVTSQLGQGCVFSFTLPAAQTEV